MRSANIWLWNSVHKRWMTCWQKQQTSTICQSREKRGRVESTPLSPSMITTKVKNTPWKIGLTDKAVVRNSRRRNKKLNVALIGFQKAYDMVPHSWILKTLVMVGTVTSITELLKRSIESLWTVFILWEKQARESWYKTGYISRRLSVTLLICSDSCYNNP